jgi:hypothetical protein
LIALSLGMGAATTKTALLLRCRGDASLIATFKAVSRTVTRLIITGLVLLVVSGFAWFFVGGLRLTTSIVVKLVLVAALFVLGPLIDNVVEPKYNRLAPENGAAPSAEFLKVQRQYVALELFATSLFYVITVFWVFR